MSYASQQQGLTGTKLVALIIALAIVGGIGAVMVIVWRGAGAKGALRNAECGFRSSPSI